MINFDLGLQEFDLAAKVQCSQVEPKTQIRRGLNCSKDTSKYWYSTFKDLVFSGTPNVAVDVFVLSRSSRSNPGSCGKHSGIADKALELLLRSEDSPSDPSSLAATQKPGARKRDAMLEFNTEPHECGVLGDAFPAVDVPTIADVVQNVREQGCRLRSGQSSLARPHF